MNIVLWVFFFNLKKKIPGNTSFELMHVAIQLSKIKWVLIPADTKKKALHCYEKLERKFERTADDSTGFTYNAWSMLRMSRAESR